MTTWLVAALLPVVFLLGWWLGISRRPKSKGMCSQCPFPDRFYLGVGTVWECRRCRTKWRMERGGGWVTVDEVAEMEKKLGLG